MKNLSNFIYVIFAIFFILPSVGFSQNNQPIDSLNLKITSAARAIMTAAKTCALITLDDEGRPRVREMDPFLPESDFTVWFGTNPKSRKVDQIKKDPRVTLYYLESDGAGYVMIHGKAQLVTNQIEKDTRWKVEWEKFYPNKTNDYTLIKVTPEWMEVVSYSHGLLGDPINWEPPTVFLTQNKK